MFVNMWIDLNRCFQHAHRTENSLIFDSDNKKKKNKIAFREEKTEQIEENSNLIFFSVSRLVGYMCGRGGKIKI